MIRTAPSLRSLLSGDLPIVVAGAHDGLSARIAEEAGFDAIWASGFEISAAHGVPDANILTMTENLDAARAIRDAVEVPVIADCDNGYGNAINVIRTVREFEKAGIDGICIEDNVFPKRCSFYAGTKRELVLAEEHAGKIRAAVDSRRSEDFVMIARTEALIAGWGMEEALRRARAYADAGADLCLIHSKRDSADEVLAFAREWDRETPLVCVPTIYRSASVDLLHRGGYKVVIFANQGLRAAVRAMRETLVELRRAGAASAIEDRIAPLEEIYRLVGEPRMKEDERRYLPADGSGVTAVVLAAGRPRDSIGLAEDRPKSLLDVKGKSILARQIETLNACSIRDIAVVRGYRGESISISNVRYYDHDGYETGGELGSLFAAAAEIRGRVVVLYGDVLFEKSLLEKLLKSPADIAVVVDRAWRKNGRSASGGPPDLVIANSATNGSDRGEAALRVEAIGARIDPERATAEFAGLVMLSARGSTIVRETYNELRESSPRAPLHEAASVQTAALTDLLQELVRRGHEVAAVEVDGGWIEIDTFADYQRAWATVR